MIPILFPSTATVFTSNGIGRLSDCIEAKVKEELNGAFDLEITYPVTGAYYAQIVLGSIILAKPNTFDDPQPFRIYSVEKNLDGTIQIFAHHLSYDLSFYTVQPFTATGIVDALDSLISNCVIACPFTFSTDKSLVNPFTVKVPSSIRQLMGGQAGSLLDVFAGEYSYDGYSVELNTSRGSSRGVTIRYGKNLTELDTSDENEKAIAGVVPYWESMDGDTVVMLSDRIVYCSDYASDLTRIKPLDLSDKFDEAPSEADLRTAAQTYITDNHLGDPTQEIKLSWLQMEQTTQFEDRALLETVILGDTLKVIHDGFGIETSTRVKELTYDVLAERYTDAVLGTVKSTITDTIVGTMEEIQESQNETLSAMQLAITNATQNIVGINGGYVVLFDADADGKPDEILIMDTPDIQTATRVWRWNAGGLGYSTTGYNGTYSTAITASGEISADMITTGILNATRIRAGVLQSRESVNPNFLVNLDTGTVQIGGGDLSSIISQIQTATDGIISHLYYDPATGLVLTTDEGASLVINGDQLTFYNGQNAVAYINGDKLYITDAVIQHRLDLGNFAFIPRTSGNLSFRWIGT